MTFAKGYLTGGPPVNILNCYKQHTARFAGINLANYQSEGWGDSLGWRCTGPRDHEAMAPRHQDYRTTEHNPVVGDYPAEDDMGKGKVPLSFKKLSRDGNICRHSCLGTEQFSPSSPVEFVVLWPPI